MTCPRCEGYGTVLVNASGRVQRVFCVCKEGQKRLEHAKALIRESGRDPDQGCFRSALSVVTDFIPSR